jgi:hypothetical protein
MIKSLAAAAAQPAFMSQPHLTSTVAKGNVSSPITKSTIIAAKYRRDNVPVRQGMIILFERRKIRKEKNP